VKFRNGQRAVGGGSRGSSPCLAPGRRARARYSVADLAEGSRNVRRAPPDGASWMATVPRWEVTRALTIDSPSPLPECEVLEAGKYSTGSRESSALCSG